MVERSLDNHLYDTHGEITLAGSSNAYTGETATAVAGYYNGLRVCAKANHDNTGAATLNLNSIGASDIKLPDGSDPRAGNIQDGGFYDFTHDSTNFVLMNPTLPEATDTLATITDVLDAGPNLQTGTSYTLVLADDGQIVSMNNGSANEVTIPTNASVAFPIGATVNIVMRGAGTTTITGDTGVTVNGVSAGSGDIQNQYQGVSCYKEGTNSWVCSGDIGTVA